MTDSSPNPATTQSSVIRLAIIANSPSPFRTHLHARLARELADLELWSVYTHEKSNAPWTNAADLDTRPVCFGPGELAESQSALSRQWHEWRKGGRIIRWLRHEKIDAVAIHGYNDLGRHRVVQWCHRNHVGCFLFADSNIRGDTVTGLKAWIKRAYLHRLIRNCTGVMPCGSLGRDYFLKYGAAPSKIHYFPCEPDYDLIQNLSGEEITAARTQFHLSPDRRRIIYCGRLVDVKRVDLVIDAFVSIAADRPDWDLLIVGDGPRKRELLSRVPTALTNRVRWLGFIDDQKLVSAIYRSCDVLALPSDYEPWALVINEAAAAGLAMVASDAVGAAAELVRDGMNGAIFAAGSLNDLVVKLAIVTDPAQIDGLKRGSSRVLEDWRRSADPVDGLRRALAQLEPRRQRP